MREHTEYTKVTKIIVEFEDGCNEEFNGNEVAFVVVSEARDGVDGWLMLSTDEVTEDTVLDFSYSMVTNIEEQKIEDAIAEAKVNNKSHLTLVKG